MSKDNSCKLTYKKCLYLLRKYFVLDPYFYQVSKYNFFKLYFNEKLKV